LRSNAHMIVSSKSVIFHHTSSLRCSGFTTELLLPVHLQYVQPDPSSSPIRRRV
jgi:hypothetical protein